MHDFDGLVGQLVDLFDACVPFSVSLCGWQGRIDLGSVQTVPTYHFNY